MSINLKTDCEKCTHKNVCRNNGMAKIIGEKLKRINYGSGPNDDYDYGLMSDWYHVNIDISCADFEQVKPVPRTSFPGRYQGPGVR